MIAWLSTRIFLNRINELEIDFIQHVLVVKGEGLSLSAIRKLRKIMPNARFHLYLWDGIDNVPRATAIAPIFDNVSTFDADDARQFGWRYRPLFARNSSEAPARLNEYWVHDWVFVGSLHSDRYRILRNLVVTSTHLRSFVYGFIPGKLLWWLRYLVDWSLWAPGSINISTTSLSPEAVQQIVNEACAVIDIEHPNQRGLTMRSIETLMSHRKLITTNVHIRDTDLYDESRVCIIDRKNPIIPPKFLAASFRPLDPFVRERYSLNRWVDEVLNKI
jgi:hypothetical protein